METLYTHRHILNWRCKSLVNKRIADTYGSQENIITLIMRNKCMKNWIRLGAKSPYGQVYIFWWLFVCKHDKPLEQVWVVCGQGSDIYQYLCTWVMVLVNITLTLIFSSINPNNIREINTNMYYKFKYIRGREAPPGVGVERERRGRRAHCARAAPTPAALATPPDRRFMS